MELDMALFNISSLMEHSWGGASPAQILMSFAKLNFVYVGLHKTLITGEIRCEVRPRPARWRLSQDAAMKEKIKETLAQILKSEANEKLL